MTQLVILALLTFAIHKIVSMETKVITTKTGKVQGVVERSSISGKYVQKFSNIPYAEPPVGKLRFAKPQPRKPWKGTLKTNHTNILCWQAVPVRTRNPNDTVTDDCLILNVWTSYPQKSNQTVMVWVHGGGYKLGHSTSFVHGNHFVAVGEVILVSINYRLSELGFLTSGDDRIKGNFGLFDQRLAFKWVKENIASFGGNPQTITIFGLSAGGGSVSCHSISKGSWPYFDRAIQHSGSVNAHWTIATEQQAKDALNTFLSLTNCTDNETLLDCLQNNVTEKDLERIYTTDAGILSTAILAPYVDGDFLTDDPNTLQKSGKIKNDDVIIGVTKDEAFYLAEHLLQQLKNTTQFIDKFNEMVKLWPKSNGSDEIFDQAIKLYSPNKDFKSNVEALRPIVDFRSDISFVCSATEETNIRSQILKSSKIYQYRYSYSSEVPRPVMYPKGTFGFVSHGLDIIPVFGSPINNSIYPSEDQILSMRMILYWTNFAKTGDPNVGITNLPIVLDGVDGLPKWSKFMNSTREYLDMESGSQMIIRKRLREEYCVFLSDPEGYTERAASVAVISIVHTALLLLPLLQHILF